MAKKTTPQPPGLGKAPSKQRPFPRATLTKALVVAQKLKDLNGGNPWVTDDVAKAVGMGAKSPKFFYVTAAARDFGLTVGSRDTPQIALAELGREIVYAPDSSVERLKKVEAFNSPWKNGLKGPSGPQ